MKIVVSLLTCLIISGVRSEQKIFVGSTPANDVVKSFIGAPLEDSVDFIRWKLIIDDKQYSLDCNYGIGQPNTNGFINGGKKITMSGGVKKEGNYYRLLNGSKVLKLIKLSNDLVHVLNFDNSLMAGNGGWSYTLNSSKPSGSGEVYTSSKKTI